MIWIIVIGLLILLWYKIPQFKKILGGLLIIIVVGLLLIWASDSHSESVAKSLIPFNQVQINGIRLINNYGSYHAYGEVKNLSKYELTGLTLMIKAYDCPSMNITADCEVIGQDGNVSPFINIPSGQTRSFDAYVSLANMPEVRGNFVWSYDIIGTRGR